ncbi:MAG TPA: hypothetical protein PLB26_13960 [Rubrivivax sp.]|nr:hypothetical protein [Rubrivivax sp.]
MAPLDTSVSSCHQRQLVRGAAQFVEDGGDARREGAAVDRRLDAVGDAVEQAHAERVLQAGDGPGHRRLRQVQHRGGPAEAAVLEHDHEHAQLAHLQMARQALHQAVGGARRCRHDRHCETRRL